MSDWAIKAVKADPGNIGTHDLLVSFITCTQAWRRLSKPARAAVEAAYPDGVVEAHPLTMRALERHGFIDGLPGFDYNLTPAGREVYRWAVKP